MNAFKIPEGWHEFEFHDSEGNIRYYKRTTGPEPDEAYWIEVFKQEKPMERGCGDDYPVIDLNK